MASILPFKVDTFPFVYASPERLSERAYHIVDVESVFWDLTSAARIQTPAVIIANWLRTNTTKDQVVLYEPVGSALRIAEGEYSRDLVTNKHQRFYFSDPKHAQQFRSRVDELKTRSASFPTLANGDIEDSVGLAGALRFRLYNPNPEVSISLWCWCQDNMEGKIYSADPMLIFTDHDDLVLFKMTFMGDADEPNYKLVGMPFEPIR